MPFPDSARTIFRRNPIEEVICQLRFPPILRLEAEAPAAFQQRIRTEYPLYEEGPVGQAQPGIPTEVLRLLNAPTQRNFLSDDRLWAVSLTRDFIALTAQSYDRWEGFRRHWEVVLAAFQAEYAPSFYSRIGLRYRNVIKRSELGVDGVGWDQLLTPQIAAEYGSESVRADIRQSGHQIVFSLGNDRVAQLRHGLTVGEGTGNETCYTIDADLYTTARTEPNDVDAILNDFNEQARRLFSWCISRQLHEALQPEPVAAR